MLNAEYVQSYEQIFCALTCLLPRGADNIDAILVKRS